MDGANRTDRSVRPSYRNAAVQPNSVFMRTVDFWKQPRDNLVVVCDRI